MRGFVHRLHRFHRLLGGGNENGHLAMAVFFIEIEVLGLLAAEGALEAGVGFLDAGDGGDGDVDFGGHHVVGDAGAHGADRVARAIRIYP